MINLTTKQIYETKIKLWLWTNGLMVESQKRMVVIMVGEREFLYVSF